MQPQLPLQLPKKSEDNLRTSGQIVSNNLWSSFETKKLYPEIYLLAARETGKPLKSIVQSLSRQLLFVEKSSSLTTHG